MYFNKYSSSFHILNGDHKLNLLNKILWMVFNFINNYFCKFGLDPKIKLQAFKPKNTDVEIINEFSSSSPSRILSNCLFSNYNWQNAIKELGKINILEIGCGRGVQVGLFKKFLGDNFNYIGLDKKKKKEWSHFTDKRFNFFEDDYLNIEKYMNNANFIFSQSVLEHLEQDILLFKKISTYIEINKRKFINLHFFPSTSCYFMYRGHGIRQYNHFTISKITKLFKKNSEAIFFYFGNSKFNTLHKKKFSRNLFLKEKNLDQFNYNAEFFNIVENHNKASLTESSFNALEIKSNL